jgi:hypothetical protein
MLSFKNRMLTICFLCLTTTSCFSTSADSPASTQPAATTPPATTPPVTTPPTTPADGSSPTISVTPATASITVSAEGTSLTLNSLSIGIRQGSSTVLNDGRLLITGGRSNSALIGPQYYRRSSFYTLGSADTLDTGTSAVTTDMQAIRYSHSLITLHNDKVLVIGGYDGSGAITYAEIFNPATEVYSVINEVGCTTALSGELKGIRLSNNKVLVVGSGALAELFDPNAGVQGCFTSISSLNEVRQGMTLTLLNDHNVLVTGGSTATAEIFNSTTNTFSYVVDPMKSVRQNHAAALLADGKVLIAGGVNNALTRLNTAEIFNPADSTFTAIANLNVERTGLSIVRFTSGPKSGQALIIGGLSDSSGNNGETRLEMFDPNTQTFSLMTVRLSEVGVANHTTVRTADGARAVVAGGWNTGSQDVRMYNSQIGYSVSLSATGGTAPYTFAISPAHGVIANNIYYAPITAATVTITATDAANVTGTSVLTLSP